MIITKVFLGKIWRNSDTILKIFVLKKARSLRIYKKIYDSLDFLAKLMEKKRSLTDLPPPLPIRERTTSLGISAAELIPSPFLTPTITPHGTAKRVPVKFPPRSPTDSKTSFSVTHQFSTLPPPSTRYTSVPLA